MIGSLFAFVKSIRRKIKAGMELRKYDRFTIAAYFRNQGIQIGEGCSIIPTELATEPYLVKIGNRVTIAQGVKFITHDGGTWLFREEYPDMQGFGPIIIEDNCVIGQNAVLFHNVRIGRNSIVGAGSVVISDVPANTIVMGNPARPLGSVEKYKEKCIARWAAQQPPDTIIEDGKNWWNSQHYGRNRDKLKAHLLKIYGAELGLNSPHS